MNENINPENLTPEAEHLMQTEAAINARANEFANTLDDEQRQAFEEIFSPVGQVLLEGVREEGDQHTATTQFGLFPEGEMTPIQHSVFALMAAEKEERTAKLLPRGNDKRIEHELEAARLRRLAIEVRS